MAGRKKGYKTPDEIREKIQGSALINRLQSHVDTDCMNASQVNAAKILLSKIIPDLKSTDLTSGGKKIDMPTVVTLRAAPVEPSDS